MNNLVIGGAGCVGSQRVEFYRSQRQHCIKVIDNYFTGSIKNHIDGVDYIKLDAKDINTVDLGCSFDLIFHLGEYSRVEQSYDDIDLVFELNHLGIHPVLEFWRNNGGKLIYSGSSTKFAKYHDTNSDSPYAVIKKNNVELVKSYAAWFNLDYAITYYYNVYGGRELAKGKYSTVIAKFIRLVREGTNELPVTFPGSQKRHFTHISDIVSGIVTVAEKGSGDGFGIGSDECFSILDVVRLLECEAKFTPAKAGNRIGADLNTEQTKMLGWKPTKSLEWYIRNVMDTQ